MACILGRKVGMTQAFGEEGELIPVTVIKAGPCKVLSLRTKAKEGYDAAVVAFEELEGSSVNKRAKAQLGVFKKLGTPVYGVIREFRNFKVEANADLNLEQFKVGDILRIEGRNKGRGWTSVIKKWNFKTGRESHGGNCQRKMGSAGMHTWPAHVVKGKKMSGRWGMEKVSLRSVEVVAIDPENHLLMVKGPLPGVKNVLLKIEKLGAKKPKSTNKKKEAA